MSKPKQFSELSAKELKRSAIEDFAVDVSENDVKEVVLAALLESGVTWDDYVAQHPEVAPDPAPVEPEAPAARERSAPDTNDTSDSLDEKKYLIKMVRDNPLFETCGHRFTDTHPYALVTASVADYILTKEEGFRQATPSELEEYYS